MQLNSCRLILNKFLIGCGDQALSGFIVQLVRRCLNEFAFTIYKFAFANYFFAKANLIFAKAYREASEFLTLFFLIYIEFPSSPCTRATGVLTRCDAIGNGLQDSCHPRYTPYTNKLIEFLPEAL